MFGTGTKLDVLGVVFVAVSTVTEMTGTKETMASPGISCLLCRTYKGTAGVSELCAGNQKSQKCKHIVVQEYRDYV